MLLDEIDKVSSDYRGDTLRCWRCWTVNRTTISGSLCGNPGGSVRGAVHATANPYRRKYLVAFAGPHGNVLKGQAIRPMKIHRQGASDRKAAGKERPDAKKPGSSAMGRCGKSYFPIQARQVSASWSERSKYAEGGKTAAGAEKSRRFMLPEGIEQHSGQTCSL